MHQLVNALSLWSKYTARSQNVAVVHLISGTYFSMWSTMINAASHATQSLSCHSHSFGPVINTIKNTQVLS